MTGAEDRTQVMEEAVLRVRADNPSPMTHTGTNSYLIGHDRLSLIDPGPVLQDHQDNLIRAIAGRPVTQIIVTHSHLDHSPLARPLARLLGCPVVAFGKSDAGRSPAMKHLSAAGLIGGGEGVDRDFAPDIAVPDGARLAGDLGVLHTPGHMGNHICITWRDMAFCGDLVMDWASSLVSPPDGDLTDFMASCARLQAQKTRVLYAGHGEAITDPEGRLQWLMDHRDARSAQIIDHLRDGPATVAEITAAIYADVPKAMHGAAARNVLAHLVHLAGLGAVAPDGALSETATFHRV